jgi:hypothetical protein
VIFGHPKIDFWTSEKKSQNDIFGSRQIEIFGHPKIDFWTSQKVIFGRRVFVEKVIICHRAGRGSRIFQKSDF